MCNCDMITVHIGFAGVVCRFKLLWFQINRVAVLSHIVQIFMAQ